MQPTRSFISVIICALLSLESIAQCTTPINSFPYVESFETGTANWSSGGLNNDWAWGTPSKPVINSAAAGTKCWITGGLTASFYSYGERSYVESPCFDFTSLDRPLISVSIFWETEKNYDGGNLQYSIDGGSTWVNAGNYNDPEQCNDQNWFNNRSIINLNNFLNNTQGWSGNVQSSSSGCNGGSGSDGWKLATHCLKTLANKPQVKFRFTFGSGTTCNDYDGFAFDNFKIDEAPPFPDDYTYVCTGARTIKFSDLNPGCHEQWNWNFGDVQSPNNTFSGDNAIHEFSGGGIFTVTLNTGGACATDTQITKQIKILSVIANSIPVSCIGDDDGLAEVIVQNAGSGITYVWSHDNQLVSSQATNLSSNDFIVTISEPGTCSLPVLINVGIGPDAYPKVSLGKDTIICPGSEFVLTPGTFPSYQWQDNSTDSFFIVRQYGIYSVQISNSSGCTTSDSIIVKEDCIGDIIVPNAFTPNGDALNEVFSVIGSETSEFKMDIFNRWGENVYTSENRNEGWDGSYKGHPVQEGFYNYIVNYSIGESERTKKGSVFILR